ncbi:MAG: hypothetical protein Q9192_006782 [Flavoplaca navasiana]
MPFTARSWLHPPHSHVPQPPHVLDQLCVSQILCNIRLTLDLCCSDIIKIIFAIFLPPVGVALEKGIGSDFCINVLLTILGYIPGIIHALYVIPRRVDGTRKHMLTPHP